MPAYYNEFDPHAAAWLRELIKAGLIADGEVDERSIADVQAEELAAFTQCHFFAGIGGWSLALRLARWGDDRPIWTGSCPCQPYSVAGKRKGNADARNLWPEFFRLIEECRPGVIFGEQVASADVIGAASRRAGKENQSAWLDGVFADLEAAHYTCAAVDLPAASVGAPHIRQRLYWVADAGSQQGIARRDADLLRGRENEAEQIRLGGIARGLGDSEHRRREGRESQRTGADPAMPSGAWDEFTLIPCRDGKERRIKPGIEPLVNGLPGRVGLLRGYGNAICPQTAAAFIEAYCEVK